MLWYLLTSVDSTGGNKSSNQSSWPFLIIMIVIVVLFMFWNKKSQKKREEEINNKLNAIKPGDKVMTIGYICGVVVEVCPEDNTLVLETGSETAGKSYVKVDRRAVFQTNVGTDASEVFEEAPVEEETTLVEESFVEKTVEETTVESTEE